VPRGRFTANLRILDVKPTFQSESDLDGIDHPDINGAKGIYPEESVILNATALLAGNRIKCRLWSGERFSPTLGLARPRSAIE
jgi:hypothetical protein